MPDPYNYKAWDYVSVTAKVSRQLSRSLRSLTSASAAASKLMVYLKTETRTAVASDIFTLAETVNEAISEFQKTMRQAENGL